MTWLIVFVGIIAFANLLLLGGLAWLAITVTRVINTSVQPTIREVNTTVKKVNAFVDRMEVRAENVMDIGEETARRISGKVVATSDMVEHTITSPLVSISSILTGISKAVDVWRKAAA